ncbi:MAG: hypothetical protein ACXWT1_13775 [Methylobacter sp.]
MMAAYRPKSLTAQINAAEQQVMNRQQKVGIRTTALVRNIHHQMTASATLLLSAGIGFIIGELTKQRPASKFRSTADKAHAAETTPLKIALNLMTSARTLYTALPLVWMMKSYFQPDASSQAPKYQFHPMAASDATGVRRSSKR